MRIRVELYVPWGQYRAVVEELDVHYTLGEAARRREEIIRKLTEKGLIGVNSELPLPAIPLRVGLITSLKSDAYNDILRTLQESGYAFNVTAHGARVQGHSTEPSVLNALDWFRERAGKFDVLLICRGGGSRTDLVWFDSEKLGKAVALFPIPVIVGIGHEQDQSVLDAVGRSCKTPTAAAALVVEVVEESVDHIETMRVELLDLAAQQILEEKQEGHDRAERLVRSAQAMLQSAMESLQYRRHRVGQGVKSLMTTARMTIGRWLSLIPRNAAVLLERERERSENRGRRLVLVNPRRVVERGYSILRLQDGKVLTEAGKAPAGSLVRAELKSGSLKLRSEGEGGE
jgi:exodeoxyribonuclease VII large subunit